MTKIEIVEALRTAKAASLQAPPQRASGCGRAYVCISDKKLGKLVQAACQELGMMYLPKAYGVGDRAIYIGYDNGTGRELAQSEAFAASLSAAGIRCYADAKED